MPNTPIIQVLWRMNQYTQPFWKALDKNKTMYRAQKAELAEMKRRMKTMLDFVVYTGYFCIYKE